ncbi:16S rRNA (uracil(1498)-N(3))-methyltransferase [Desulfosediminicola flagellatus]|uniref:16S rRNA (uracil(1498)-N(3))-methyltransferase n=1 Tax=Desulfosediminicola flagellatus TaxID=2569541 RepID=UPI00142ED083|nr:16S rRNA (uracil(1498)-N(3))-methyltransferase [Desulfosediminicola flagellatus]
MDGDSVELPQTESRHIVKALRLQAGDAIELLDGKGSVFSAIITIIGKTVKARIVEQVNSEDNDTIPLVVCQGHLKGKKMDLVIQKCTELGVNQFIPLWTSRCQGKISEHHGQKKLERYQRIVESACKQCYRPDLMEMEETIEFSELVQSFPDSPGLVKLMFWEEEGQVSLHDPVIPEDVKKAILLLGPEGGLSLEEAELARASGWQTVSLGKRILRAETATLTATSVVQFLVKNM